jgi:hypothetical protein
VKSILEKNGYNNITNRSISFLIDSSSTNNSFSVQVIIDLDEKATSMNKTNGALGKRSNVFSGVNYTFYSVLPVSGSIKSFERYDIDQQLYTDEVNTENSVII